MKCDQCSAHRPLSRCLVCLDDVCAECMPDGDPETARGICLHCQEIDRHNDALLDDPRTGQAAGLNRKYG